MAKLRSWTYDHFIGIDVSKLHLDFAIMEHQKHVASYKIENKTEVINSFSQEIKSTHRIKLKRAVFGMESTGIYCNHFTVQMEKSKANLVIEDAGHLKKSIGTVRGKSDTVDALRIAKYLVQRRDELILWKHKRKILGDLARLSSLRERLISVSRAILTPLKEEADFVQYSGAKTGRDLCAPSIAALESDKVALELYIESLWKGDTQLDHLMELMMSVPGIGPVTALQVLICTNEFRTIKDPRKFACYCGVAPFQHNSGTSVHRLTKVSKIANIKIKTLLHSCALSARRFDPEIKAYYDRKTQIDGKHGMCVMNAIRFKLIARIFACVNNDRKYEKDYCPR